MAPSTLRPKRSSMWPQTLTWLIPHCSAQVLGAMMPIDNSVNADRSVVPEADVPWTDASTELHYSQWKPLQTRHDRVTLPVIAYPVGEPAAVVHTLLLAQPWWRHHRRYQRFHPEITTWARTSFSPLPLHSAHLLPNYQTCCFIKQPSRSHPRKQSSRTWWCFWSWLYQTASCAP